VINTSDLRQKNRAELHQELLELLREQFNLRMQRATGQTAIKSHLFRQVRHNIARVRMVISEKVSKI
jgi:large subunit ribosomal protein L29